MVYYIYILFSHSLLSGTQQIVFNEKNKIKWRLEDWTGKLTGKTPKTLEVIGNKSCPGIQAAFESKGMGEFQFRKV